MLIPRDRPVYENLNTSFTDFDELLRDLAHKELTGALRLAAPSYRGLILFAGGEPLNALEERPGQRAFGISAANSIASRARERDGSISVYTLSPELAGLLARAVEGELIHRDLSSAFTSFERLLAKLQAEKHTGYLEIAFTGGAGSAMVFIDAGDVVDSVSVLEGQGTAGAEAVAGVFEAAERLGATCNVYRATVAAAPAESAVLASLNASDVLAVWSEIISGTEEVVDAIGGPGAFVLAFRETLINGATAYPFLDPFAAELEYRDGQVTFDGPPPEDLSRALGDCLADTIARLAFRLKRADLETRIRERHTGISQRHGNAFERFQLGTFTQQLIA